MAGRAYGESSPIADRGITTSTTSGSTPMSDVIADLKSRIMPVLAEYGWKPCDAATPAVAELPVKTIQGTRNAYVFLIGSDRKQWLIGDFWSEGINTLRNDSQAFRDDASDESIRETVTTFANQVRKSLDSCFAVRMLDAEVEVGPTL